MFPVTSVFNTAESVKLPNFEKAEILIVNNVENVRSQQSALALLLVYSDIMI